MATHGSVVQFDPEKEEWTSYVERLNYNNNFYNLIIRKNG